MIKVYLTPEEMSKCWEMAKARHEQARGFGSKCLLEQGQEKNPIKVDAIGLYGEVAYCKAFGLPTSLVFDDDRSNLEDLQLGDVRHNGYWVDIKASEWKTAKLIYPVVKEWRCKADYLCLVTCHKNECVIRGFSSKSNFMREENIGKINNSRPSYILEQEQLTMDVPMNGLNRYNKPRRRRFSHPFDFWNNGFFDPSDPRNGEG